MAKTKYPRMEWFDPAGELGLHNRYAVGDCAMRAMCAVTGEPFLNIVFYIAQREPLFVFGDTGVADEYVKSFMRVRGWRYVDCSKRKLKFTSRKLPRTALIFLSDHVTALVDGKIKDATYAPLYSRKIWGYFYKEDKKAHKKR